MARFSGKLGFVVNQEIRPGVWEDVAIDRKVFGDVLRDTRKLDDTGRVNGNLTIGNTFSVVVDAFINENIFAIRYVEWKGVLWTVSDVEVKDRRIIIRPGGVYNGPKAPAPDAP